MSRFDLKNVEDDPLLAGLRRVARREREATALVVAHLVEVEGRRLFAREGFSSLFNYCVQSTAAWPTPGASGGGADREQAHIPRG